MLTKKELEEHPLVIAEVGQNHQGSLETAREYIKRFVLAGADVVKFQTRNIQYLFSEDAYNRPYENSNSFDQVYGRHREKLELKVDWLPVLLDDCHQLGVKFMSTPFDEPSLEVLEGVGTDLYKIASFDLGNLPFIDLVAQTRRPVVISTGGGNDEQIRASVETVLKYHSELAILHCVSEYPCEFNRLGLNRIETLSEDYPELAIGLSDHFNGTLSGPVAYLKGARIFEKHVTLNRAWKGTDHSFALEPEGFRKFIRDISRVGQMLDSKKPEELGQEAVWKKLGKSLVARVPIGQGEAFTLANLSGRIFVGCHIPVRESIRVVGRRAGKDFVPGEPIRYRDVD